MAKYKELWESPIEPIVIGYLQTETNAFIPLDSGNMDYQEFLIWQTEGGIADPAYTQAEIDAFEYEERQSSRLNNLRTALIYQFKMILAIYQVGRDKGLWLASDFDQELRDKAIEWKQLIDDYENDTP